MSLVSPSPLVSRCRPSPRGADMMLPLVMQQLLVRFWYRHPLSTGQSLTPLRPQAF